ncbi:MAG TPA: DUF4136 domain-containing protein [Croceibacterium sp.]|jgi:hypothetical protein|nr:DUF4136 domain-containing protein [Croceibacterium sp.]
MRMTTHLNAVKLAVISLALAALAACTNTFNADVTHFNSQVPPPAGQTFVVVPEDPALAGGIEFQQYASRVADHMAALGYRPVNSPSQADLIVKFDYGVDRGRERVTSSPGFYDPFWSPWYSTPVVYHTRHGARIGYISRPWGFGWYDPFFGGPNIDSYTVYTSGVDLKIERASDHYRYYEGKAQAVSMSNRLQYLVPNLVEAIFTNFPGNSGQTERISIAPEGRKVTPVRR